MGGSEMKTLIHFIYILYSRKSSMTIDIAIIVYSTATSKTTFSNSYYNNVVLCGQILCTKSIIER